MAISTYTELKTAVANWLDRSDLTNRIPEFIVLGESEIFRRTRLRTGETRATLDTVGGVQFYALPAGYKSMRNFKLNGNPKTNITYLTPEQLDITWSTTGKGTPCNYTVIGDEIKLGPIPDVVYEMEMAYWKRIDPLSDSNPTNFFMDRAPDILMYAALMQAEGFLQNDQRIQIWRAGLNQGIDDLIREDWNDRFGGSAMTVSADMIKP